MSEAETIRNFIRKNMTVYDKEVEFSDDDNIFTKGFVNSLFAMRLVQFIEKEFSIAVENDDLDIHNFSCVSRIVAFIAKKKG